MEQDRQDEPSHIEQGPPASLEPAQGSREATQVPASTERTVYEATKLDERGPIVESDESLRQRIVELEQRVQMFELLEQERLAALQAAKDRERERNREYSRRYRERHSDEVRRRNAAWMRAKRARERGQDGQGNTE